MRKDKLNHNAENYRTAMPVLLVALFGMIAYLYINAETLSVIKIIILGAGILIVSIVFGLYTWKNIKDLNELEEMN